jgi:3-deoxy-D-manno-octulosonic-acid transferase
LGKILYSIFIAAYHLAFNIAAMFNKKARAGIKGRQHSFSIIGEHFRKEELSTGSTHQVIWMHCASLGEFEQGRPVLESLHKKYPAYKVALSFFSASGYETMKNYSGADVIFYLPFDGPANAKQLVDQLNPALVLWVKYEFWFHYLHELKHRKIPVLLLSGIFREDQPFFQFYGDIWKQMLTCFRQLFVQNEHSATLLETIDIKNNVQVSGDTRFDRVIQVAENFKPLEPIAAFCKNARVLVAGSTWEDDEAELTHYVKANPALKFIIAPHEITDANLADVREEFPGCILYSALVNNFPSFHEPGARESEMKGSNVLIIDNVGMLSRLYYYADVAHVGGGFGAEGVHNVLEAAVYGKPVIFGPEFEKYAEAIELVDCGAGIPIQNALELEKVLDELWEDKKLLTAKSIAAREYVYTHNGASRKIVEYIQENRLLTN